MLEPKLFAILEHTADAAFTVDEDGKICSWNKSAQRLFGHAEREVLHRDVEEVLDAYDGLGTEPLAGGSQAAIRQRDTTGGGIPNFDLDVRTASGARLWINVSTIIFDNPRSGRRLYVRLARDISAQRRNAELHDRVLEAARQLVALTSDDAQLAQVEPLSEQERRILKLFAEGSNAKAIARTLRISAQTLRNHLHRINRKLRTHNRLEAVTHAQRRGLLG